MVKASLTVSVMRDGGFTVAEYNSNSGFNQPVFAGTLDDCLSYIKGKYDPPEVCPTCGHAEHGPQ